MPVAATHRDTDSQGPEWLTLSEAARRLHVHPTTLRRWADGGQIAVMLTPGGHRRFAVADVEDMAIRRHTIRRLGPVERVWANHALKLTRERIASQTSGWLEQQSEQSRLSSRALGQQLLELSIHYVTSEVADESVLGQARGLGCRYGQKAKKMRLRLTDALQASMFFRDALVTSAIRLPKNVRVPRETQVRLLNRINELLDEVQLGIAETYDTLGGAGD